MSAGSKHDAGKARYDLADWTFIEGLAKVLTHGAAEYGDNNWQKVEDATERYFAAAHRHLTAWRLGEKLDSDSKLPHLCHAAANLMFLAWFDRKEPQFKGNYRYHGWQWEGPCFDFEQNGEKK